MGNKVRIRCTGCQTLLQLSEESRGKEVTCPKCSKKLRVPGISVRDLPMAVPVDETPKGVPMAQLVDDENEDVESFAKASIPAPTAIPKGNVATSGSSETMSRWIDDNDSTGYTASRAIITTTKNKSGMTDFEEWVFHGGVVLLFVPLVATVLPFLDLQLKALAYFGSLAPLFGIFIGIFGSLMITFARHRVGDQIAMGAASALLTTLLGIIGCFVGVALNPGGINWGFGASEHARSVEEKPTTWSDSDEEKNRTLTPGSLPNPGAISGSGNSSLPTVPPSPVNNSPNLPPMNSGENKVPEGPPETQFEIAEGRKYPENPGLELKQGDDESSQLLLRMAKAKSTFLGQANLFGTNKKDIATVNLIGYETASGLYYDEFDVKALCGFSPIGYLDLVPIELTETQFAHALRPKVGEVLIGLRFAMEKEQIVGFQAIFHGGEEDVDRDTIWMGRETEDKKTSMMPEGVGCGFVVYKNGPASVGFGWVTQGSK